MLYLIYIKNGRQYIYTTKPFITTTNTRKYAKPFKSRKTASTAAKAIQTQWKLEGWTMGELSVVPQ